MGQAKRRGSFEQRQAEGVARKQEEERLLAERLAALEAERAEKEAQKTPEERARGRSNRLMLASMLAALGTPSL
jgi:hypothetical protein